MGGCVSASTVSSVPHESTTDSCPHKIYGAAATATDSGALRRVTSKSFHRQYLLEEKIGEGSFARVYSCRKLGEKPEVSYAVKITDLGGGRDEAKEFFAVQEAAVLRQIGNQEHCCRLIDSLNCRRFHYIVLERCDLSLLQLFEEHMEELNERTLAPVVKQMFQGVEAVHAAGVVHRDIKPDNFLCTGPSGVVKLCDFGLADVLPSNGDGGVTGVFGTAPFMAPEMVGGQVYGRPADAWSLGVIIYCLVVGQFPYIPKRPCVKLMRAAILAGVPEPSFECADANVELSTEVQALLKDLLIRDPTTRPSVTQALTHEWFGSCAGAKPAHCLRETLESAKKVGAFELRSASESWRIADNVDRALSELQKKHRLADNCVLTFESSRSVVSEASTADASPSSRFEPSPPSSRGNSKASSGRFSGRSSSRSSSGRALGSTPYGVLIAT